MSSAVPRIERAPSDLEGRVFEPLVNCEMCLNNLTCARPEVIVGIFEESGAGMRIDRRDFPKWERYRDGTEVI